MISDSLMFVVPLLITTQASNETVSSGELKSTISDVEQVADQSFDCMNEQTKIQMRAHITDATPESVVDGAIVSCKYLKDLYAEAASKSGVISPSSAQDLANDWFISLRETYIKQVDTFLSTPNIAKYRSEIVITQWRRCITDKAMDWYRLNDDAATIAQAAITSCRKEKMHVVSAHRYELKSLNLPIANPESVADNLQQSLNDLAIETIISERAKHLPQRR